MRTPALSAAVFLLCGAASAQPFVFEGSRDSYKTAQDVYSRLGEQCPRLISSVPDFASIGLHLVAPGSQGVYGPIIQQFEARSVLVVTIKINPRATRVPVNLVPKSHVASIAVIDTPQVAILVLDNPAALWLCDKSIVAGDRMALIPAPALHEIFGR